MRVLWSEEGVEIPEIGELSSIDFEDSIDEDDVAELRFVNCPFNVNDRPEVQNGQIVLVQFGRGADIPDPFPMIIEEAKPDYGNGVSLMIRAHDIGTAMKDRKKHRIFEGELDQVLTQIATEWRLFPFFDTYGDEFDHVQRKESDYSYLSRIAKKLGWYFYIAGDALHFRKNISSAVLYKFIYRNGKYLKRFTPTTSRQVQAAAQTKTIAEGFNPQTRQVIKGEATPDNEDRTRLAGGYVRVDAEFGGEEIVLGAKINTPVIEQSSVEQAAKGIREDMIKSQQEAEFYCPGFHDLRARTFIQIEGVAEKDAGNWRVKKSKHRINNSGYSCIPLTLDRENIGLRQGANIGSLPGENAHVNTQEAAEDKDVIINAQTGESLIQ